LQRCGRSIVKNGSEIGPCNRVRRRPPMGEYNTGQVPAWAQRLNGKPRVVIGARDDRRRCRHQPAGEKPAAASSDISAGREWRAAYAAASSGTDRGPLCKVACMNPHQNRVRVTRLGGSVPPPLEEGVTAHFGPQRLPGVSGNQARGENRCGRSRPIPRNPSDPPQFLANQGVTLCRSQRPANKNAPPGQRDMRSDRVSVREV